MNSKKVLIIDDSALMRQLLTQIINQEPGLEVVAAARDPYDGWDKIQATNPDVITLDVEMPKMDGVVFLEKLMTARPMPVVMVSSLTEKGCETTLRALECGAVDFVSKPKLDVRTGTLELASEIVAKLKVACHAKPRALKRRVVKKDVAKTTHGAGATHLVRGRDRHASAAVRSLSAITARQQNTCGEYDRRLV